MKFLKQLFCMHLYANHYKADKFGSLQIVKDSQKCTKCKKIKKRG